MAGDTGNAWQETALVSIAQQSGTDATFQALTETIDIDQGEKDFEAIPLLNGGRLEKLTPETETTVTIEAYPLYAGSGDISAATTISGFVDLLHAEDTSQPLEITSTRARTRYRLAILWTDDTSITNANAAVGNSQKGLRFVGADGFITSAKPAFTDGILKWTITFKVAPFQSDGDAIVKWDSNGGSSTMTALASYTSSTRW